MLGKMSLFMLITAFFSFSTSTLAMDREEILQDSPIENHLSVAYMTSKPLEEFSHEELSEGYNFIAIEDQHKADILLTKIGTKKEQKCARERLKNIINTPSDPRQFDIALSFIERDDLDNQTLGLMWIGNIADTQDHPKRHYAVMKLFDIATTQNHPNQHEATLKLVSIGNNRQVIVN